MVTHSPPNAKSGTARPYEVFWNRDGRHVSKLTYTDEQIDDINEIVEAVLRGMAADKGLDIEVTDEVNAGSDTG